MYILIIGGYIVHVHNYILTIVECLVSTKHLHLAKSHLYGWCFDSNWKYYKIC